MVATAARIISQSAQLSSLLTLWHLVSISVSDEFNAISKHVFGAFPWFCYFEVLWTDWDTNQTFERLNDTWLK